MAAGSHTDIRAALLRGPWVAGVTKAAATTISAASADNSINDSANGFLTAGFKVGDVVNVLGFTALLQQTMVVQVFCL